MLFVASFAAAPASPLPVMPVTWTAEPEKQGECGFADVVEEGCLCE